MRTRSELLADLRDMGQDETLTAIDRATAAQAADLLDATEPRPWPPPEGMHKCLAWRKSRGWFACEVASHRGLSEATRPKWWQPMPPEPEVNDER